MPQSGPVPSSVTEPPFGRLRTEAEVVAAEAIGRGRRADPVLPGSGGPAGNARLTAWTGLVLLPLLLAELVTLLDVQGLISWHVAIGVLLIPPALLKTASTGWRIMRYYTGSRPYRTAGPPPLALRILGPLVVAATLALLASGVLLILLGEERSRSAVVTVLGQRVDWLSIHQGLFVVFAVVAGLHLLARIVPALALTTARVRARVGLPAQVPAGRRRLALLLATLAVAALAAGLFLPLVGSWGDEHAAYGGPPPAGFSRDR